MRLTASLILLCSVEVFALSQFQSSQVCKKCHPLIYQEHFQSQHRKASIFNDEIHKAIWDRHPLKKKEKYTCAKCHTPNDKRVVDALKYGQNALPIDNKAQEEGVSCVSCHNITSIEKHAKSNKNIITKNDKVLYSARKSEKGVSDKKYNTQTSLFGFVTKNSGSPFHEIDFTNELYYNGNVCMGCHSHKENSHRFEVCKTDTSQSPNSEKENCITCHMPKIKGSLSTLSDTKTHRYHGFTGTIHKPKMLAKYVNISFTKNIKGFTINIKNNANHALLLHPLRMGELRVSLTRNHKSIELTPVTFIRVIGKDKKPSPPWIATQLLKNTQIQAKELRKIFFSYPLQSGDKLLVTLGHYIVNPQAAKKLNLSKNKKLTQFRVFKEEQFNVK
ncbi:multiheme c-type cytochrome [Sulfurimonas sp.]